MAVLEYDPDGLYPVLMPVHKQALILLPGDQTVVEFHDESPAVTDLWTPVQRAVWVARLRAVADQIEQGVPVEVASRV